MNGDKIKQGLDGLSKMDNITDILFVLLYWIGVICVILLVAYVFSAINCYMNRKRRGYNKADDDNFLDD